jgi:acyl carrier protein
MIKDILALLDRSLGLGGRSASFTEETHLLGELPELDSIGVVSLITALEEHFGIGIDDDEIDGSVFASVGTLVAFVQMKTKAA